jgi:hypothetical protein
MVKVTLRLMGTNDSAQLDMDPSLTVSACKTLVAAKFGISDVAMRLIYKGRVVPDTATVTGLQLRDNETIIVHAGKPKTSPDPDKSKRPPAVDPPPADAPPHPTNDEIIRAAQEAMDEAVLLARFTDDQIAEIRRLHQRAGSPLREIVQVFLRANENPQIAARMIRE